MKINQEWFDCVIYQDIESLKVYVREEKDFNNKFLTDEI